MDFDRTSPEWTDHDYGTLRYGFGGVSTVVTKILTKEGIKFEQKKLSNNKDEWKAWLQNCQTSFLKPTNKNSTQGTGICMILCGRAEQVFDKTWKGMQPPIQYLPFDRNTFLQLVKSFHIHPSITRTIGRDPCYFSIESHINGNDEDEGAEGSKGGVNMLTCTARTSTQLADDLALSHTFIPETGLSFAVMYGCNAAQQNEAIRRIERCDLANVHHPLLIPGMFFEMERVRLGDAVDNLLDEFALKGSSPDKDLDLEMDKARMIDFLRSCYLSRELVNHIKSVQQQIAKLVTATKELPEEDFAKPLHPSINLARTTRQILTRLQDISHELTTKTHDCGMVKDNMSLTMQTAWNHFARQDNLTNLSFSRVNTELARTNTDLSQDMKRDSSQMRSIALLTMVFLPMTTVASLFSTTFFSWDAREGERVVSQYWWVLMIVSVGLTGLVVGIWYFATHRGWNDRLWGGLKRMVGIKREVEEVDLERGMGNGEGGIEDGGRSRLGCEVDLDKEMEDGRIEGLRRERHGGFGWDGVDE